MTKLFRQNFVVGLVLISLASLVCFGILGVGRSGESGFDFTVMYAGGRAWLEGLNPYNQNDLNKISASIDDAPFSYPPPSAVFFVSLALLSYPAAKIGWLVLNLLSVAAIVAMTFYSMNQHTKKNGDEIGSGIMTAFIIGNPITTNVVWQGQTSLIAFAATMAAWFFSQQKKWILAGMCLGLASLKPNICVLVVIWFLLERSWKILAVALGTAGVLSIYPMLVQGPIGTLRAWYERIQTHTSFSANTVGSEHTISLESLLYTIKLHPPSLSLFGVALVIILWIFQKKVQSDDLLAILMALTLTFIFNMDSAYVCTIPIFTSLCSYSYAHWKTLSGTLLLVFLFLFPRRIVRNFDIPVLNHWRTVVVLILLTVVIVLSIQHQSKRRFQEITF